jgi:small subunit ribosomal protein S17
MRQEYKMQERKTRTLSGVVVSRNGDKSVKVVIDYRIRHPKYGKYVRHRTKIGVHDERNQCVVGDLVEIAQCRPISASKSHTLVKILAKAEKE